MERVNGQYPTSGNDVITGTSSAESIDGLSRDDTISGEGGNDILIGGEGINVLKGMTEPTAFIVQVATRIPFLVGKETTKSSFRAPRVKGRQLAVLEMTPTARPRPTMIIKFTPMITRVPTISLCGSLPLRSLHMAIMYDWILLQ